LVVAAVAVALLADGELARFTAGVPVLLLCRSRSAAVPPELGLGLCVAEPVALFAVVPAEAVDGGMAALVGGEEGLELELELEEVVSGPAVAEVVDGRGSAAAVFGMSSSAGAVPASVFLSNSSWARRAGSITASS
jgi:hypothetical protein